MGYTKDTPTDITRTASGVRERVREDHEERAWRFLAWHRTLPREWYGTDIDFVEWKLVAEGVRVPVALYELTRVDGNRPILPAYLGAVLKRYRADKKDAVACDLAALLGCQAWLIIFRPNLKEFWVYNLSEDQNHWWHLTRDQLITFMKWLRR